jgi:preprotein translocase subunit SecB
MTIEAQATNEQPEFGIQRIYTKDISFEAPNTPQIFTQDWQPELKLELQTGTVKLDADIYEVTLTATATVSSKDKVAFLVEVKQSGIFSLKNFASEQIGPMLGVACPSIIFPYAREVISDVVVRGGFPQLCLAPVNFDALYAQHLEQQSDEKKNSDSSSEVH